MPGTFLFFYIVVPLRVGRNSWYTIAQNTTPYVCSATKLYSVAWIKCFFFFFLVIHLNTCWLVWSDFSHRETRVGVGGDFAVLSVFVRRTADQHATTKTSTPCSVFFLSYASLGDAMLS